MGTKICVGLSRRRIIIRGFQRQQRQEWMGAVGKRASTNFQHRIALAESTQSISLLRHMVNDRDWRVRAAVAKNPNAPVEVIEMLGQRLLYKVDLELQREGNDIEVGSFRFKSQVAAARILAEKEVQIMKDAILGNPTLPPDSEFRHEFALMFQRLNFLSLVGPPPRRSTPLGPMGQRGSEDGCINFGVGPQTRDDGVVCRNFGITHPKGSRR